MSANLTAPALGAVDGTQIWYATKGKFCLCFYDTDLIDDQGTNAELTLQLTSQPTDGQTFVFQGQTYTYRTASPATWEILIGALTTDTLVNTALALYNHPTINVSDYVVVPSSPFIVVSANIVGPLYDLTYANGTSPLTLISNIVGVLPTLEYNDYRLVFQLLYNTTSNSLDWEIDPTQTIIPRITRLEDGTWEASMCARVDELINARVTRTLPDVATLIPTLAHALRYDWFPKLKVRYSAFQNGVEEPKSETTSELFFTDAISVEGEPDYELWSPRHLVVSEVLALMSKKSGLSYCKNTLVFLYFAIKGTESLIVNVEWNDGSGWVGAAQSSFSATRDTILEVRPHALYPTGFVGQVRVIVEPVHGPPNLETITFKLGGCCGLNFYFINRFGKFEIFPCLGEAEQSWEITTDKISLCEDCDQIGSYFEYNARLEETHACYSQRLYLSDPEDLALARDFFASTETYLEEDGELIRVYLSRSVVNVRESAGETSKRLKFEYLKLEKNV